MSETFSFSPQYSSPQPPATTQAVSEAISRYRQLRCLTRDELAHLLRCAEDGLDIDSAHLRALESGEVAATVDELTAIAYVLEVSPIALLTYLPMQAEPGTPSATGVPRDVDAAELTDWMHGRTSLDEAGRRSWWHARLTSLRIAQAHHEEQLDGARQELRELGTMAVREAGSELVEEIEGKIRDHESALHDADIILALAENQFDALMSEHEDEKVDDDWQLHDDF